MTTPPYPGQDPQYPNAQSQNSPSQPSQYQPPQYQPPQYQPQSNPYPGGGYPGGGYPGQGQQGPVTPPATPGTVKGAFLVYVIVAVLALVTLIVSLTSSVWQQAIDANANLSTSGIDAKSLVNAVKIAAVVSGVVFIALYLFFAFKMRAGRNWARIVLTVLSALSILSSASARSVNVNGTAYHSTASQAFSWLGAALAVVAIVLMYLPASNAYFSASKAARQRPLQ